MLYIYGGRDTWSACQVIVSAKVNSKSFIIPGANHFKARINNMPQDLQKDFEATLNKFLDVEVDLNALK
jgi:hypothetical protein